MLYVEMNGRTGNQLFDYSFARRLSILLDDKMVLNFQHVIKYAIADPSWRNELETFLVAPLEIENKEKSLIYTHGNILQIMLYVVFLLISKIPYKSRSDLVKRQERFQPFLNRWGIFFLEHGYSEIVMPKTKNIFVNGTYEDPRWFNDIRDILIEEIVPKNYNHDNDEIIEKMQNSNSVSVSVRCGDFLAKENASVRNICNQEYYKNAFDYVMKEVKDLVFFFFSDDIEWVKKNVHVEAEAYYESGTDTVANTLYKMSFCKNFILANSTFSWWGEYLSKTHNEKHLVIAPDHWMNIPGYTNQLINKQWTLIEC